jgi:hypothetical protein
VNLCELLKLTVTAKYFVSENKPEAVITEDPAQNLVPEQFILSVNLPVFGHTPVCVSLSVPEKFPVFEKKGNSLLDITLETAKSSDAVKAEVGPG